MLQWKGMDGVGRQTYVFHLLDVFPLGESLNYSLGFSFLTCELGKVTGRQRRLSSSGCENPIHSRRQFCKWDWLVKKKKKIESIKILLENFLWKKGPFGLLISSFFFCFVLQINGRGSGRKGCFVKALGDLALQEVGKGSFGSGPRSQLNSEGDLPRPRPTGGSMVHGLDRTWQKLFYLIRHLKLW